MCGQLELPPPGWAATRMRHKLSKWALPGFPERTARSVLRSLQSLRGNVAPRVQVAVLRSLFHGWVTEHRFGRNADGQCRFGCGGDDKVRHYLHCRVVHDFARRHIGLDLPRGQCWAEVMFAAADSESRTNSGHAQRIAILHYVTYRAVHALRHIGPLSQSEIKRLLQQALIEATRGHLPSRSAILVRSHP